MEIPVSFDVHRKIAPFAQNNGTRWWHEDVNTGTSREVRNARRAKNSNGSRDAYPPSCCLVIRRHNGSRPATLLLHQWRKEEKKRISFDHRVLCVGHQKNGHANREEVSGDFISLPTLTFFLFLEVTARYCKHERIFSLVASTALGESTCVSDVHKKKRKPRKWAVGITYGFSHSAEILQK